MAGNMGLIVKKSFPEATLVIDRFHVQKLALDALQEIRIKHRWEALDAENDAIENEEAFYNSIYSGSLFGNQDSYKFFLEVHIAITFLLKDSSVLKNLTIFFLFI